MSKTNVTNCLLSNVEQFLQVCNFENVVVFYYVLHQLYMVEKNKKLLELLQNGIFSICPWIIFP